MINKLDKYMIFGCIIFILSACNKDSCVLSLEKEPVVVGNQESSEKCRVAFKEGNSGNGIAGSSSISEKLNTNKWLDKTKEQDLKYVYDDKTAYQKEFRKKANIGNQYPNPYPYVFEQMNEENFDL